MLNDTIKTILKLYTSFKSSSNVTAVDFIKDCVKNGIVDLDRDDGNYFLDLIHHEAFLKKVAEHFTTSYRLRIVNEENLNVLIFYILFLLVRSNWDELLNRKVFYMKDLLDYLSRDSNYLFITKTACKSFENSYVLDKIISPLLNKADMIQGLKATLDLKAIDNSFKYIPTKPKPFHFAKINRKTPPAPVNTPAANSYQVLQQIRTRQKHHDFTKLENDEEFEKERLQNIEKAKKLLIQANQLVPRLAEPKKIPKAVEPEIVVIKASRIPPQKDVPIKGNLTTTLREASRLLKEQEDEIKKIDDIIKGGYNMQRIQELEKAHKIDNNQKEIEAIQRKHLQGMLTYEEAILAKKKLVEENREKTLEMKALKTELLEKLEAWKEDEQERVKVQVEKCQKIKNDAKESEKKLQEEKAGQVKLQRHETKELLRQVYEEKAKELSRKMDIIREIKVLHEISMNMCPKKEFDPTESPNYGLLCEMSIAELQERLNLAKIEMREDLDKKRNSILEKKAEQQKMVENVKNFIAQTRLMSKPKTVPIFQPKLEQSPDLIELKKLLDEKRSLRMKTT